MFARLDFRRFLVCCSGDIYDDESEEKPSVAICGGSTCILTGLLGLSRYESTRAACAFTNTQCCQSTTRNLVFKFVCRKLFVTYITITFTLH